MWLLVDGLTPSVDLRYHKQSLSICSVPFVLTPQTLVPYVRMGSIVAKIKYVAILGGSFPNLLNLHFMAYSELLAFEHKYE